MAKSLAEQIADAIRPFEATFAGLIEDLPGLCDRVCTILSGSTASIAYCDVESVEVAQRMVAR